MDLLSLSKTLVKCVDFLGETISWRIKSHFGKNIARPKWDLDALGLSDDPLSRFIKELSEDQAIIVLMALCPHYHPVFFDEIINANIPKSGGFPNIGGTRGKQFGGFLPTGETALFVLGGTDLIKRLEVQQLFNHENFFYKNNILWLEASQPGEPLMSGKIILSSEYVELFTSGKMSKPKFSTAFPAQEIQTQLEWEDLILPQEVKQQIYELENWIKHNHVLLNDWDMGKRLNPGYRALLYGPPGTGKTMTASLLGKYTGRDVYRIDLSTVVSKYIGETEKNLASLFERAESKNWILFFDEADSLFGKRTSVRDAHDKYANQEVSYLLQRIERFDGLVILASNFKSNIDEAFLRRFSAVVKYPLPNRIEREEIWLRSLPKQLGGRMNRAGEIAKKASKYELSGGHILNVVQYISLKYIANKDQSLPWEYVTEGIKREIEKEGRVFSE